MKTAKMLLRNSPETTFRRHSRAGGKPAPFLWLPACTGMTIDDLASGLFQSASSVIDRIPPICDLVCDLPRIQFRYIDRVIGTLVIGLGAQRQQLLDFGNTVKIR